MYLHNFCDASMVEIYQSCLKDPSKYSSTDGFMIGLHIAQICQIVFRDRMQSKIENVDAMKKVAQTHIKNAMGAFDTIADKPYQDKVRMLSFGFPSEPAKFHIPPDITAQLSLKANENP